MSKTPEKFLFNRHNFDNGTLDITSKNTQTPPDTSSQPQPTEPEEPPPPPSPPEPTFTQSDLDKARKDAFQDGLKQGKEEQKESHNQTTQTILNAINEQLPALKSEEQQRIQRYEQETLLLTQIIFKKLFPYYTNTHGLNELTQAVKTILTQTSNTPNIKVNVSPDTKDAITTCIKTLDNAAHIDIHTNENLTNKAFEISWPNGGASMNIDKIEHAIDELLTEATQK